MLHYRRKSTAAAAAPPAARPRRPTLARRLTPGSGARDRDRALDLERDSFPQFCMTCEKQFVSHHDRFLYCSESCRRVDQSASATSLAAGLPGLAAGRGPAPDPEPRDIVPRAAPSRPASMLVSSSPPSSAVSALRCLALGASSPAALS